MLGLKVPGIPDCCVFEEIQFHLGNPIWICDRRRFSTALLPLLRYDGMAASQDCRSHKDRKLNESGPLSETTRLVDGSRLALPGGTSAVRSEDVVALTRSALRVNWA